MIKKLLILLIFLVSVFSVYSASDLLSCGFETAPCAPHEAALFYANKYFHDSNGNVLSSNVRVSSNSNYDKALCCKINKGLNNNDLGVLNVSIKNGVGSCQTGFKDLMYFSSDTNARIAFKDQVNNNNYPDKLCLSVPNEFSHMNIFVSDDLSYGNAGYSCLYRTNKLTNGLVSSCNATFNSGNKYKYVVWAKLWENVESLKCNSDCTSKLDGRVYSACSTKIDSCRLVNPACDGSISGAWVKLNDTTQIQCSAPWTLTRNSAITQASLNVTTLKDRCSNLIKKKYSVILNNEPVTMNIYECQN